METVTMQCGKCGQVMAINLEHLGSQVHCPHCQAVVETMPPKTEPPQVEIGGWLERNEAESIFAPPEASDDLFGQAPDKVLVEIPREWPYVTNTEVASAAAVEPATVAARTDGPHAFTEHFDVSDPAWNSSHEATALAPEADQAPPTVEENLADLSTVRPHKRSLLVPTLLIFLIPYSIIATIIIGYLLYLHSQYVHPLEALPDPKSKVQHEMPLPNSLKTRLAQTIRVGDLEVTPLRVHLTRHGDLELDLKTKNLSREMVFTPISDEFLKYADANRSGIYTFLDAGPRIQHIYGGFIDWQRGPPGRTNGDIGPGQEELIRITTAEKYRPDVKKLPTSPEPLLWRVQVRRGLLTLRGNPVPATAVIGISFQAKDIRRGG